MKSGLPDDIFLVNFGAHWNADLEYIKAIWYILWPFGNLLAIWYIFPILVFRVKKNLATLIKNITLNENQSIVGWGTMVSHRSGETEDCFIADLVVGLGTGQGPILQNSISAETFSDKFLPLNLRQLAQNSKCTNVRLIHFGLNSKVLWHKKGTKTNFYKPIFDNFLSGNFGRNRFIKSTPDQDRSSVPVGTLGQVQPAAPHRGGARGRGKVCRRQLPQAAVNGGRVRTRIQN
jgi:hypothetical protein